MPVTPQLVRFGVFELDLNTGELCKNGRKLKLQEQPFRLLSLLLEQPGQTITRNQLKEVLWPSDTFVDFDHSLNAAIAKLRQSLGDSAENPRFIETLARRGYRFIAPVEATSNGERNVTPVPAPASVIAAAPVEDIPVSPRVEPKIRIAWVLAIGFAALAVATAFAIWLLRKPEPGQAELVQLTNDIGLTMDPAVSPDGRLLAYASDRADGRNLNIWIQQLSDGGSAVQLTHFDADTSEPSFSPDGNKIAFHSGQNGGGIYVIPTVGGEPVRLASTGRDPRFSPDGQWIAYWRGVYASPPLTGVGGGEILIVPATGGPERRIGSDLKDYGLATPIWASDSTRVLVSDSAGDSIDWWMIYLDGKPSRRTDISSTLKQQGFRFAFDRIPHFSEWGPGFILFSAPYGDTYNAWRLLLSDDGRSTGPAQRLTSGTTLEVSPVLTASGSLIFASLNLVHSVWGIPGETNRGVINGDLKRITDGRFEFMPSISSDGRRLAFAAAKRGATTHSPVQDDEAFMLPFPRHSSTLEIRVKDLDTGTEAAISGGESSPFGPEISGDGSMVAYAADEKLYVTQADNPSRHIVSGAGKPWGWSPKHEQLFFCKFDNQRAKISVLDVASGRQSLFLSKPDYNFFQARYSPDARAVAVIACAAEKTGCWVSIVPLNSQGIPQTEGWIAIDHPSLWDDKPRWSPNGDLLYFISDRDGHLCLWAQRLDLGTKRPIGAPFPVYHFHNSRLAMINVGTGALEIDVARDKIVMGLGELTGNIWSLKR
jgi:Tol biopolymer transport system component/DNA-binding winged helix-turn-helix (wHTH) protein